MIKNRTAQLIFQTIYCTLGLVGCIASLGIRSVFGYISDFSRKSGINEFFECS